MGGEGGSVSPYGQMSNQTSGAPGSGYPDQYYQTHSNDSAPTSPPMSGGSLNMQNSSVPTNTCNCNQMENVQEQVPSDQAQMPAEAPAEAPAAEAPAAPSTK